MTLVRLKLSSKKEFSDKVDTAQIHLLNIWTILTDEQSSLLVKIQSLKHRGKVWLVSVANHFRNGDLSQDPADTSDEAGKLNEMVHLDREFIKAFQRQQRLPKTRVVSNFRVLDVRQRKNVQTSNLRAASAKKRQIFSYPLLNIFDVEKRVCFVPDVKTELF